MKKVLASLSFVALFVAFTAYSTACDTEGKCKGKSSSACCMSKASAKKACCSTKSSEAKVESSVEPASTAVVPAKNEGAAKPTSVKAVVAPKATSNK